MDARQVQTMLIKPIRPGKSLYVSQYAGVFKSASVGTFLLWRAGSDAFYVNQQ